MEIPLEVAYATSCQTIGEGVVREKLLGNIINQKDARIKELEEKLQAAGIVEEATGIVEGASDATNHREG